MKNLFALLMVAGTLSFVACSPKAEEKSTVAADSVKTAVAAPTATADSAKTAAPATTTTPAPAEKK